MQGKVTVLYSIVIIILCKAKGTGTRYQLQYSTTYTTYTVPVGGRGPPWPPPWSPWTWPDALWAWLSWPAAPALAGAGRPWSSVLGSAVCVFALGVDCACDATRAV